MRIVTLEEVKAHSKVELECESERLVQTAEAAEEAIENMLGRTYDDLIDEKGCVPVSVKLGILMLTTHLYDNNIVSPVPMSSVPYTIDPLLRPYMKWED